MAAKRALIVDDSATARLVLGRLLTGHGIKVDGARSAEEALEYLEHARPDVVFMDHQMPGMDGLEALQAIKANPDTATIPVMMYTSQEGEVYVGQARALGAIGVLPKQVAPVEVSEILRSLRLIGDAAAADDASLESAAEAAEAALESLPEDGGSAELRDLLRTLFRQQRDLLRRELESVRAATAAAQPGRGPWRALSLALAVVSVIMAALWVDARRAPPPTDMAAGAQPPTAAAAPATAPPAATASGEVIEALGWALGQNSTFGIDEAPLDAPRAAMLESLFDRLDALGFAGTVVLRTHLGRFCLVEGADGGWLLPPPGALLGDCDRLGWPESEAVRLGGRQTLGFANGVARLATRHGERIRLELETAGGEAPRSAYPEPHEALPVSEWNTIAADNQRVEIMLFPDD